MKVEWRNFAATFEHEGIKFELVQFQKQRYLGRAGARVHLSAMYIKIEGTEDLSSVGSGSMRSKPKW